MLRLTPWPPATARGPSPEAHPAHRHPAGTLNVAAVVERENGVTKDPYNLTARPAPGGPS